MKVLCCVIPIVLQLAFKKNYNLYPDCMSESVSSDLRMLVSPCRSGSSPLLQALSQSPDLRCLYQNIKSAMRETGKPDYDIFYKDFGDGRVTIDKETIGHRNQQECELVVFPSDDAIRATRPVFLFRDPVEVWNAWFRAGWGDIDLFNIAFQNVIDTYHLARSVTDRVQVVFYDQFEDGTKEAMLRKICEHWSIVYKQAMVEWQSVFGRNSSVEYGRHTQEYIDEGRHDALVKSRTLEVKRNPIVIPADEIARINRIFREQYDRVKHA